MSGRVSVALCMHNGARFIETQLRSILYQHVLPDEIVISDDASSDDTVKIARRVLAEASPRGVRIEILLNDPPLGVTANFENAIRATTGNLIVLSDQDDVWHPNRLSRAVEEFARRPDLDLVFSDALLVDEGGNSLDRALFDVLEIDAKTIDDLHGARGADLFIKRNMATGATIMFRRQVLDIAMPFPKDWVHDEWLSTVASIAGRVDAIEEKLVDYRQHSSNQIGVNYPTLRRKITRTLEPRGGRNARLSRQFAQLAERFALHSALISSSALMRLCDKAEFEDARQGLPKPRLMRIAPVAKLYRRGWYGRFASQGRLDILRDLLQTHSG